MAGHHRFDAPQRLRGSGPAGEPADTVREVLVDEVDPRGELYDKDVTVKRGQVEKRAVEDIALATGGARLLPPLQVVEGSGAAAGHAAAGIAEGLAQRRRLAGVEPVGDRGRVLTGRVDQRRSRGEGRADTVEVERQIEDVAPTAPRLLVQGQSAGATDMALRGTRGESGHGRVDAVTADEDVGY